MKKILAAFFTVGFSAASITLAARTEPFMLGADISWIDQREASGTKYADNGTVKDIFLILKEHKFNWIRLRIFVDPTATVAGCDESPYSRDGYCDPAHTLKMAKRAKAAGFKILLDFHYSDVWADPAKQFKPVSWSSLSFDALKTKVRTYTKGTLEAFEAQGTLPDMVQVGNEIVGGMIWPDGRSNNMSNFAALVNAGIDGVKDVSPDIRIFIHSISENSPNSWLKSLVSAGVKRIDVFGLSYYSKWHGTPADMKKRVEEVAKNNSIKIAIAEYADNHREVNDIIYNLPGEKGVGTFAWEPQEWMEAIFDWKNNRRETNAKIDLYPVMSKDFGNDDFVVAAAGPQAQPYAIANQTPSTEAWFDYRGMLHSSTGSVSIVTLQGRSTDFAVDRRSSANPAAASGFFVFAPGMNGLRETYVRTSIR